VALTTNTIISVCSLLASMIIDRLSRISKNNTGFVVPAILIILIIIVGGFGVYLVEHNHRGTNITTL
jgi:uncharacterized membrane protein YdcZ (DUF606 family)